LHDEEMHTLYCSLNVATVMKYKMMERYGRAECIHDMRNTHKILVGNTRGKRPLEGL